MKFRINSVPFNPNSLPPSVQRAIAALDELPDEELVDYRGLADILKVSPLSVNNWSVLVPDTHRVLKARRVYYANPKTIKAFKAELQAQRKTTR